MQNISSSNTENHTESFPSELALTEQQDPPLSATEPPDYTQTLAPPPTTTELTDHTQALATPPSTTVVATIPIASLTPQLTIAQEIDALTDPSFMTSMARGLAVVKAFSDQRRAMTIAQLSYKTGIPRAAVRRCLYTLKKLGYAGSDANNFFLTPHGFCSTVFKSSQHHRGRILFAGGARTRRGAIYIALTNDTHHVNCIECGQSSTCVLHLTRSSHASSTTSSGP